MYSFDTGTDFDTGKIFTRILFLVERIESQTIIFSLFGFHSIKKKLIIKVNIQLFKLYKSIVGAERQWEYYVNLCSCRMEFI